MKEDAFTEAFCNTQEDVSDHGAKGDKVSDDAPAVREAYVGASGARRALGPLRKRDDGRTDES